jgi:trimeric autotransporter adhesin
MPDSPITNFKDSNNVDLGKKLVTKDYLLEVYGSILENSPASGLVVTPELWVWGSNEIHQLGINNPSNPYPQTPITTFAGGANWKQVSAGNGFMAAIKTDGSLWTWGNNTNGKLGVGDSTERRTPVTTFAGGTTWKQVDCGETHTAAIKTDGSLWTWGLNSSGQLGNFSNTLSNIPVTTFSGGNTWKSVACGNNNTAAIKTDGTLWTWGDNNNGKLGINGYDNKNTPVTTFVGGTTWKQVSCGGQHTVAIKTDGSLWNWGRGGYLANNNAGNNIVFPVTTFAGGNDWKQVSCGGQHTAAIKTDGSLWTWGNNTSGQLGNFSNTLRNTPVTTLAGGNNWKSVSAGNVHTGAIKTDGSLWGFGANGNFTQALGINENASKNTPVTTFVGGNDWKQVAGGSGISAAIKTIDYI